MAFFNTSLRSRPRPPSRRKILHLFADNAEQPTFPLSKCSFAARSVELRGKSSKQEDWILPALELAPELVEIVALYLEHSIAAPRQNYTFEAPARF